MGTIEEKYNVYTNKDGRMRAYNKETHKVVSYPRVVLEEYLGRLLEPGEDVHHKDENPLNNNIDNLEVISHEEHERYHANNSESFLKWRKYKDIEKVCPVCGKTFIWTPKRQSAFISHNSLNGPFCSQRCSGIYLTSIQYNKPLNMSPKMQPQKVICAVCGKEFVQSIGSQYRFKNGTNQIQEPCCSTSCYHAYRRLHKESND